MTVDPLAEARRHWTERWGDGAARSMHAVTAVMRAQQVLLGRLNELLRPFGLTFARYEALMLLSFTRTGELPIGKIGDRLQVHRTSATNIVQRLEADGLVRTHPSARDGRSRLAAITPPGRDIAQRATAVLNAADFCLDTLTELEQERIGQLLSRVDPDTRTSS